MAVLGGRAVRTALAVAVMAVVVALAGAARAQPVASMVMDMRSGEVYHADNADTRLHPASLTKMMTLYIAFEAIANGEISLDTMVTISRHAASEPPSRLGLRPGQRIALRYLIRAAAIRSANDAATAIAEAISGSEAAFAERMTRTARAMGMRNTTFRNAHGLTQEGHLSTARDMTILGRQLFFDYPQYYNIFSRRTADAGIAQVTNTNSRFLDSYRGADGIKTGYTRAAGFNLVASAERGSERIVTTVFGGRSVADRNRRVAELMDLGFDRAPTRVAVQRPSRPAYRGPGEVVVAEAPPPAAAAERPAAGRVIRLNTAVARSLWPAPNPARLPPPVAPDAVAEALMAAVEAPPDEVAPPVAEPPPFAVVEAPPAAAEAPPPFAVVEAPVPFEIVEAPPVGAVAEAEALAALRPMPRPEAPETPAAPEQVAEAAPVADAEPEVVAALDAVPDPEAAEVMAAPDEGVPPLLDLAADVGAPGLPLPAPDAALTLTLAGMEAEAAAEGTEAEAPREVIVRVSTQSPRIWGVNLGRLRSRSEAERLLMRVMLSEVTALDGGLRRIESRGGGFDAVVLGLAEHQAGLACRRLTARGQACTPFQP